MQLSYVGIIYLMLMNASYNNGCLYLATCLFEQFKSLCDEIAKVESLSLTVLYVISDVGIAISEEVEYGEDLTVIWYQGLTNHIPRKD